MPVASMGGSRSRDPQGEKQHLLCSRSQPAPLGQCCAHALKFALSRSAGLRPPRHGQLGWRRAGAGGRAGAAGQGGRVQAQPLPPCVWCLHVFIGCPAPVLLQMQTLFGLPEQFPLWRCCCGEGFRLFPFPSLLALGLTRCSWVCSTLGNKTRGCAELGPPQGKRSRDLSQFQPQCSGQRGWVRKEGRMGGLGGRKGRHGLGVSW